MQVLFIIPYSIIKKLFLKNNGLFVVFQYLDSRKKILTKKQNPMKEKNSIKPKGRIVDTLIVENNCTIIYHINGGKNQKIKVPLSEIDVWAEKIKAGDMKGYIEDDS